MTTAKVEAADFRHDKMPTEEGHGNARRAFRSVMMDLPEDLALRMIEPGARRAAVEVVMARLGFGIAWQLNGGFEGMRRIGLSDSAIYRKIKAFRESFGMHPDEFAVPGVRVDPAEFLRALAAGEVDWPPVIAQTKSGPFTQRRKRE